VKKVLGYIGWALLILFLVLYTLFTIVYAYGLFTGKIPSRHERAVCTCVCPQPEKP
jgi:hypothetical protein